MDERTARASAVRHARCATSEERRIAEEEAKRRNSKEGIEAGRSVKPPKPAARLK